MLAGVPGLDTSCLIAVLDDGVGPSPAVTGLLSGLGEQALPELTRALGSGRDDVRDGAVTALAGMGRDAWPALVPLLRDPSHRVRLGAARALEGSGWAPADPDETFAYRSALGDWETVAAMGPGAAPFLVETLRDPHPGVREQAARALGRCCAADAVPLLQDLLAGDPEEEVRTAAAGSLGGLADSRAIPALREALADRSHAVRAAAATALDALGWRPESDDETAAYLVATAQWAALAGLGAVAVPGLVRVLGDDYYEVRRGAGETLLGLGPVARPALVGARESPDPAVRDEAAALLARMPAGPVVASAADSAPVPEETEIATQEPAVPAPAQETEESPGAVAPADEPSGPEDRPAALRRLGHLGDPASLGTLAGALYAGSPDERLAASEALASMPPGRAVPALAGALLDLDPALRESVATSLGTLAAPAAMPLLVDCLADPDEGVRGAALDALARAGPAAFPALVTALGRPEPEVRAGASDLLAHAGYAPRSEPEALALALAAGDWRGLSRFGEDALEPLAALLAHPDPALRLGAVVALGGIPGERAADLVRQAYADPSPLVRNRAAQLLRLRRTETPTD